MSVPRRSVWRLSSPGSVNRLVTSLVRMPSRHVIGVRLACLFLSVHVLGCAGYQRYAPAPLDAGQQAVLFAGRRLDDPELLRLLAAYNLAPADSCWESRQLALAAVYERPDLEQARAAIQAAQAAEVTAGVRPPPSIGATAERGSHTEEGKSSPWTLSLSTGLTIETGGKRSARTERARAAVLATTLRLQAMAWDIASETRNAVVAALDAERGLASARAEASVLQRLLGLLQSRFAEGQVSRVEVARTESDLQTSLVAITEARRTRTEARLALARSLAVPLAAVDSLRLRPEPQTGCATLDSVPSDTLQALALRHRYDLGAALADYAVTEGDLRLALAQQYPDLTIGPGISWDQGIVRWLLSVGVPAIPVARNRGPIAEAVARRAAQAARAVSVQDSVLAGLDSSFAACREAGRSLMTADSLVAAAHRQVDLTNAAYQRGEIGQVELALAQLALVSAGRVHVIATGRRARAGMALETAVGMWLGGPVVQWLGVPAAPTSGAALGAAHHP